MAALIDINGPRRRFELGDRATVGRAPGNTICLPDPHVSSRHAEIRRLADGQYELVNLSTTNGTFLRGTPVSSALLSHGDEIRVGATMLTFDGNAPAMAAGTPPPARRARTGNLRSVSATDVQVVQRSTTSVVERPGEVARFRPASMISSEETLRSDYEKLRGAYELTRAIGGEDTLDGILECLVETAMTMMEADRVVVLLVDAATGRPIPRVAKQRDGGGNQPFALSETLLREVASRKAAVLCEDVEMDERFKSSQSIIASGIRSAMCVPMVHEGELLGMIHLDSRIATKVFGPGDLEVFTAIASQAAFAVKNALLKQHVRELEDRRSAAMHALVSGASHFINNPLSVIRSNLALVSEWATMLATYHGELGALQMPAAAELAERYNVAFIDGELAPMAGELGRAAERIGGIVEALRLFEHSGDGAKSVALHEVLAEATAGLQARIAPVATLHTQPGGPVAVHGVRERLLRLFSNLLVNSCQAILPGAPERNAICVSTEVGPTHVVVHVDDTGRGLPPGDEDKVFVPFVTSRLDGSLGLGLPIAAEIVRQHQGTIRIGARPDGGTRVSVCLPVQG